MTMKKDLYQLCVLLVLTTMSYSQILDSSDDKNTISGVVEGIVSVAGVYNDNLTESVVYKDSSTVALNCSRGSMNVDIAFKEPFYGIVYSDFNRYSACKTKGTGGLVYSIELPLRGCGTIQDPQRVFTNNVVVRYHSGLELDGDEVTTIICKYDKPITPVAAGLPRVEAPPVVPVVAGPVPLGEIEILLIICAILFLAFLLLGIGCSYYCLKKRNIKIVRRRRAVSQGPGSEITTITLFDGLKIPRAHATSTEETEQSDSIPSDYPSESPSDGGSEVEDNAVQIEDKLSSIYSDTHMMYDAEYVQNAMILAPPKFDVAMRVKKPDPAMLKAHERTLTTILEREETRRLEELSTKKITHIAQLHKAPPAIYAQIRKAGSIAQGSIPDNDDYSISEQTDVPNVREFSVRSLSSLGTEMTDPHDIIEYYEHNKVVPRPQKTIKVVDDVEYHTTRESRELEDTERLTRELTEYHQMPPPPSWDVMIRNYPANWAEQDSSTGPEWEQISDQGTVSDGQGRSMFDMTEDTVTTMTVETQKPINWEVLVRVLEPPKTQYAETKVLTDTDREKWRQIITTESTLRTLLSEAEEREDFESIRKDQRYEKLFEPIKWDVIIRVLTPPDTVKRRRPSDMDSRSRKSSVTSRRTSRSSLGYDMRSMTEEVVTDFARTGPHIYTDTDTISEVSGTSGTTETIPRSMAERSTSEIVEHSSYIRGETRRASGRSKASRRTTTSSSSRASRPQLERSSTEYFEEVPQKYQQYSPDDESPPSQRHSEESRQTDAAISQQVEEYSTVSATSYRDWMKR